MRVVIATYLRHSIINTGEYGISSSLSTVVGINNPHSKVASSPSPWELRLTLFTHFLLTWCCCYSKLRLSLGPCSLACFEQIESYIQESFIASFDVQSFVSPRSLSVLVLQEILWNDSYYLFRKYRGILTLTK